MIKVQCSVQSRQDGVHCGVGRGQVGSEGNNHKGVSRSQSGVRVAREGAGEMNRG